MYFVLVLGYIFYKKHSKSLDVIFSPTNLTTNQVASFANPTSIIEQLMAPFAKKLLQQKVFIVLKPPYSSFFSANS